MSAHPRVVFDCASIEERNHAQIWIDENGVVKLDREGTTGRKATPSEMEAARDARAAAGKKPVQKRGGISGPPGSSAPSSPPPRPSDSASSARPGTNHHREIPGDGVARGA